MSVRGFFNHMILLITFAFLAGIITILSPCILPILPVVLAGSVGSGKKKPLGIVLGFVLSFTFFTLFLSAIVQATGIPTDKLRSLSIIIIALFGISLLFPSFQIIMERLFSKLSGKLSVKGTHEGFSGGVLIGLSLGLIWTPCVGPIIASVITLAATSEVTLAAFFITLAYAVGTAIPMFAIMYSGRSLLQKVPWLLPNTGKIQKVFGILMILTAIGLFYNVDRKFQSYILDVFPQYGTGLTSIENNTAVKEQLDRLFTSPKQPANQTALPPGILQKDGPQAPEVITGGEWFNSEPLTLQQLRGKVVIIDFWTYSCINCQRTLPYLRMWHEKYSEKGLVIIGVHAPEFAFEKDPKNVQQAIKDFVIPYPVVQDNDFQTWQAYQNRYWPAKYIIDKDGKIRYSHFGEGAYEETEQVIQELLKESGQQVSTSIESSAEETIQTPRTPETYLGSNRMEYYFPSGSLGNGTRTTTLATSLPENMFSLGGEWTITPEHAVAGKNAVLNLHFTGQKVFLVMRPGTNTTGTVRVYLDGKPIQASDAGKDVKNGIVTINKDTLYTLVELQKPSEGRILQLEFQTPGIEVFAFTFG